MMEFQLFRKFVRNRRGSLLVETAFTMSILAMLSLGGAELARYTLLHQKMERIAASIGDLIAQAQTLSEVDVTNVFAAVSEIARPFDLSTSGVVIISSIGATGGGGPTMNWQRLGGGVLPATSLIATTPGASAAMPTGFTVSDGETVITAEVMFDYQPWLFDALIGNTQLYHTAFFRPRLGTLSSIN
jgi:Flp pilus assembly protein TadG